MLKSYFFFCTICPNSDVFRYILIICTELLIIKKTCIYIIVAGFLNTLKFVHKMLACGIKFVVVVHNRFMRRAECSTIDFFNDSYQEDVKFMFWYPAFYGQILKYLIIYPCFYICFIDVNSLPEDDQEIETCHSYNKLCVKMVFELMYIGPCIIVIVEE